MPVNQLSKCCNFAFSGLRIGARTILGTAKERLGATTIEYAFLAGLLAMVAAASFQVTGTAVAALFDDIATVFVASMPSP